MSEPLDDPLRLAERTINVDAPRLAFRPHATTRHAQVGMKQMAPGPDRSWLAIPVLDAVSRPLPRGLWSALEEAEEAEAKAGAKTGASQEHEDTTGQPESHEPPEEDSSAATAAAAEE
mmetsp:Transcript_24913/g.56113  ORF Transcript_24913/g.56113 Transcript_24913/m.56113 type:complete len:118 (+) Transcript_24913:34-387(+)